MKKKTSIYLAGPEVFLPNAKEILDQKSSIARETGFIPIVPGDAKIPKCETKIMHGIAINKYDEKLMISADAIVANLTPFRGVSADTGTCFELGFMCALGRHVCAYTNDKRNYIERVSKYYNDEINYNSLGEIRTKSDGMLIEDFEMIDNLMLHGSIETRSGLLETCQAIESEMFTDLTAYRKVIERLAKSLL